MNGFKRLTTIAILAILTLALAAPAFAGGRMEFADEAPFARARAASYAECGEACVPPVTDVVLRVFALVPATLGLNVFAAFSPFVALSGPENLGPFWAKTAGGPLAYIFLDPLGTH